MMLKTVNLFLFCNLMGAAGCGKSRIEANTPRVDSRDFDTNPVREDKKHLDIGVIEDLFAELSMTPEEYERARKAAEQIIEERQPNNEIFTIKTKQSGQCIEIINDEIIPGANIQQGACRPESSQVFEFIETEEDTFLIKNLNSGLCVTISTATKSATNVVQFNCIDNDIQKFQVIKLDEYSIIKNKFSDMCLDISQSSDAGNTIQWDCHGEDNQLFFLEQKSIID